MVAANRKNRGAEHIEKAFTAATQAAQEVHGTPSASARPCTAILVQTASARNQNGANGEVSAAQTEV